MPDAGRAQMDHLEEPSHVKPTTFRPHLHVSFLKRALITGHVVDARCSPLADLSDLSDLRGGHDTE